MKKFVKFAFKRHKLKVFLILIFSILQTYFQLSIIKLFETALKHMENKEIALLNADGQLMIIYSIILISLMIAIVYLVNNITIAIGHESREKIFHIMNRLPPKEFNKFSSTDLMNRTTREVYLQQNFIQIFLKKILVIPFVTIGIIIEIALIDIEFAILLTIFTVIFDVLIIYKLKKITTFYFEVKKSYGRINLLFREKITGLKTIMVLKKDYFEKKKFNEAISNSYEKSLSFQLSQYYIPPLLILISDLFIVFLLMYLFDYSINPAITIINHSRHYDTFVEIVVILQYLMYYATTLLSMHDFIEYLPKGYSSSKRIEEMLDLEEKIIENKNKTLKSNFKGIEFRNVSFGNNGDEIIRNVSFKIPDKSSVAIVGPYSSGKTVLMYLLNRLYEADEGEILIGGYDINDLTSEELKGKINFAIQKNFIFHDTVYNNIVLGDELITKSDVYKACEATGLSSEFNDEFNLDTLIFENASNLSNILQKKIMLTRSIVRDKDIYIFDEYDYRVENKTNIILTKNIEQIKDIDHIIVLDKGQVVGEGNHEELLNTCLVYKELYVGDK